MSYNKIIRDSILSLFGKVEAGKIPDNTFNSIENLHNSDQIFERRFAIGDLVCNLFDVVEKHCDADGKLIKRIIFKSTIVDDVDIKALEYLLNKIFDCFNKESGIKKIFTNNDKEQFLNKKRLDYTYGSIDTDGVILTIFRRAHLFELRISFFS